LSYICVLKLYELNPDKLKHCFYLAVAVAVLLSLNTKAHSNHSFEKNLFPENTSSRDVSLIRLRFSGANGSSDECVLHFYNEATTGYDWMYDAIKMESLVATAAECAFISTDNYALSIDSRPIPQDDQMIQIMADLPVQSDYVLTVIEATALPEGFCIRIEDSVSGQEMPVIAGENMELEDNGPFNGNRFLLVMEKVVDQTILQPLCNSDQTGEIHYTCSMSGATVSLWQNEILLYSFNSSEGSFTDLEEGNYLVTYNLSDPNCSPVSFSVSIDVPEPMYVDLLEYGPSTCNSSNDAFAFYAVSNSPEYNFTLTNGEGDIVLSGNSLNGDLIFDELSADIYDLEIDGVCGVINTSVDLRDPNALQTQIEQENIGLIITPESGGILLANVAIVENASYNWFLNNSWIGEGDELQYGIAQAGEYVLRVEAYNGACHANDSVGVHVELLTAASGLESRVPFSVLCTNRTLSFSLFESDSTPLQFSLMDMSGRQVWKTQIPQHAGAWVEASFGELPVGQYILNCSKSDQLIFSQKWVVH
jgi:hypothetical protein